MEGSSSFYKKRRLCISNYCYKVTTFKVFVTLGFIWLLTVNDVVDSRRPTNNYRVLQERLNEEEIAGFRRGLAEVILGHSQRRRSRQQPRTSLELINFVSKRRVPNGPDPIHNRRAGNSNQPPGRAQRAATREAAIKDSRRH
ncbi:hypothetical protein M9H77_10070 [Catharanthus roseus]|uniref:Uncharacterized protein n=1 Tax=Catharanthus roseus TaxID=4058 RepID=A0ACC0C2J7_CATRO|nr:hypothetical protein M9H77_10070 [Catharanthus roseus]